MSATDSPKSGRSSRKNSVTNSSHVNTGIMNLNISSFEAPCNSHSGNLQNGNGSRTSICDDDEDDSIIKIPIIGFEVMEERARFTVFKLRVENEKLNETWLVFRRYTDFERLHAKIQEKHKNISINLPPKRWIRDNFETAFLEDRMKGLQAFVDSIMIHHKLTDCPIIREFFCLDQPPLYPENAEESRAMYGSLEESIMHLKDVLNARQTEIQILQAQLALVNTQHENLLKQTRNCHHCCNRRSSLNLPSPLHSAENSMPMASSTPNFSNSPVTRNRNSSARSNHSSTSHKSAKENQNHTTTQSFKSFGKSPSGRNQSNSSHPQESPRTPSTSSSPPIKNGHSISHTTTTTTTPSTPSSNYDFNSTSPSENESADSSPKTSKDERAKDLDNDSNTMLQSPSVILIDNS